MTIFREASTEECMEKSSLKSNLFFLLLCCISVNIRCGEHENIAPTGDHVRECGIVRLSEEQIDTQYKQIVV